MQSDMKAAENEWVVGRFGAPSAKKRTFNQKMKKSMNIKDVGGGVKRMGAGWKRGGRGIG